VIAEVRQARDDRRPVVATTFVGRIGRDIDSQMEHDHVRSIGLTDDLQHLAPPGRAFPRPGRITITYQATLTNSVVPGQLLINTANLTYTSLPGANGTITYEPNTFAEFFRVG
jgi:hypothetical protein